MGIRSRLRRIFKGEEKPKSKEELWSERGVTIGKYFDGPDSAIDYRFGHLVTIVITSRFKAQRFSRMMDQQRRF